MYKVNDTAGRQLNDSDSYKVYYISGNTWSNTYTASFIPRNIFVEVSPAVYATKSALHVEYQQQIILAVTLHVSKHARVHM